MTKQEAIETIKLALSQVEWDYPLDYGAAFDMAISAMEKQDVPDTNVGDMINRSAAIDAVNAYLGLSQVSRTIQNMTSIQEILENLPPAQPEIIRCKDCKWKQGAECVRFAEIRPFPDDFCSRGERRAYG